MIVGKKCYLTDVDSESNEALRAWRNNPEIRQYFREHREITKSMQKDWYEKRVHNNPNQYDFEIHDIETNQRLN